MFPNKVISYAEFNATDNFHGLSTGGIPYPVTIVPSKVRFSDNCWRNVPVTDTPFSVTYGKPTSAISGGLVASKSNFEVAPVTTLDIDKNIVQVYEEDHRISAFIDTGATAQDNA